MHCAVYICSDCFLLLYFFFCGNFLFLNFATIRTKKIQFAFNFHFRSVFGSKLIFATWTLYTLICIKHSYYFILFVCQSVDVVVHMIRNFQFNKMNEFQVETIYFRTFFWNLLLVFNKSSYCGSACASDMVSWVPVPVCVCVCYICGVHRDIFQFRMNSAEITQSKHL